MSGGMCLNKILKKSCISLKGSSKSLVGSAECYWAGRSNWLGLLRLDSRGSSLSREPHLLTPLDHTGADRDNSL
jgi:hypothetical protein